ncbi:MAG: hypothetical protein UX85_C0010G0017 [Candidatus Beckwithbacteria bacterium GW2011_GWB1_47_15]|uniref:EfeO-type cupredoxin-like domain-containing protein n=1 Tax=Candidatus Beckwithbacteria bacterium GW2011_GWB1_47_15 TaxID=1618371 RepID=A0A0G1RT23_9BACT|nr:MAG: hypothetical protein UY43_C0001G0821 [Candidatus Beckwithbacteria bacterium GW2011_GWC1_49_16]AQS30942.1 hypothetical protein [uncultured bacterium]KKU34890.1 MAG: hypothetical protein UX50_C0009G0017 [Candidatus Beckwithbacteria bacterium GW2011_GWA1_46_30]KKU60484.1 MAG: hypothetical protein UX85_C0010G0017 [Candidatus Beckwithbacteria bacterium GW2011_GWB1_47_15]KKU72359.1 MAG: hypothetical protein UX97_C0001G0229 [Candidatus Beckwithbacteria bacterium GW2011_GWA2_47_25]OGD48251.1 M
MKKLGLLIIALIVVAGVVIAAKNKPSQETSITEEVMPAGSEATSQEVKSGSYFFDPFEITAKAGTVTITNTENQGFHTFVIDELGVKETLAAGTSFSFEAEPGTYAFYCDVGNHRELGMEGVLTVE